MKIQKPGVVSGIGSRQTDDCSRRRRAYRRRYTRSNYAGVSADDIGADDVERPTRKFAGNTIILDFYPSVPPLPRSSAVSLSDSSGHVAPRFFSVRRMHPDTPPRVLSRNI